MHESSGPTLAVTLLEPLCLVAAEFQQLGRLGQFQFASFHSAQHFGAPYFLCPRPWPSQFRVLLRSLRLGDISIGAQGDIIIGLRQAAVNW